MLYCFVFMTDQVLSPGSTRTQSKSAQSSNIYAARLVLVGVSL